MAALPVVTVPDADAYFLTTPRNADWLAIGANHQVWLNESHRFLDALCYDQTKDCCGRNFGTAWVEGVSELALALSKSPNAVIGTVASATGQVKRQKLGDLEQEFFEGGASSGGSRYGTNAPKVLQAFPWLGDILGCWLNVQTGSSRIIARVRS